MPTLVLNQAQNSYLKIRKSISTCQLTQFYGRPIFRTCPGHTADNVWSKYVYMYLSLCLQVFVSSASMRLSTGNEWSEMLNSVIIFLSVGRSKTALDIPDRLTFKSFLLPHGTQTCRLLFLCVSHAINEIDKIWQQISRRGVVRTGWSLIKGHCCTSEPRLVNFGSEVPWGAKILKGIKIFCNAFLEHRLAERDEIWHDKGHLCVAGHFLLWWTLVHFSGSQFFDSGYFTHFLSERNEIWQP